MYRFDDGGVAEGGNGRRLLLREEGQSLDLLELCFLGIPGIFSHENGTPERRSGVPGLNESSSGNWEDPREEDEEREEEEEKEGLLLREDEEEGGDFDGYDELGLMLLLGSHSLGTERGRVPRDVDEESIKVSILTPERGYRAWLWTLSSSSDSSCMCHI